MGKDRERSRRGSTDKRSKKRDRDRDEKRSDKRGLKKKRKVEDDITTKKVKEMAKNLVKKRINVNPALLKEQGKVSFVKPVFMSRKARNAMGKGNKKHTQEDRKKVKKNEQKERDEFFRSARYDRRDDDRDSRRDNRRPGKTQLDKELESKSRMRDRELRMKQRQAEKKQETQTKELELIWKDYMGAAQKKKQFLPPSQKFKFDFDWKASEDTSEDLNELYKTKAQVAFRFGRGTLAGMDEEEQMKANRDTWAPLLKKRKTRFENFADYEAFKEGRKKQKDKKRLQEKKEKQLSRHWADKQLDEMTERDWRILKEDFRITTKFGGRLPNPVRFWGESGLPKKILDAVQKAGYKRPTPIQRMAIPVGLKNRDCVGVAETGSGKTAAFVLPMLVYLEKQPPITQETAGDGPQALILAPTRELAYQIEEQVKKFSINLRSRSLTIVGGVHIEDQGFRLRDGIECVIATPGRLNDCIDRRYIVLIQCNYIVLDEADLMIDMGFEPQVTTILEAMPSSNLRPIDEDNAKENMVYRQTFMFSATMPPAVEKLTRKFLRNPVYIEIGDKTKGAENVEQHVMWCKEVEKRKKLESMIATIEPPAMVFCNTKKAADALTKYFKTQGLKVGVLHGGKTQTRRTEIMKGFKDRSIDYLFCTNVAGRGIDVEGVNHVINFDMPNAIDAYQHRIGRTGRAGKKGVATTFLCEEDNEIFYDLKKLLIKGSHQVPHQLMSHDASKVDPRDPTAKKKKSKVKFIDIDKY